MTQSILGRNSRWSPRRGTSPLMLFKNDKASFTCAVVRPLPVANVPVREGLEVPENAGHWVRLTAELFGAVSKQVSARFRKSVCEKIDNPGKLRRCSS